MFRRIKKESCKEVIFLQKGTVCRYYKYWSHPKLLVELNCNKPQPNKQSLTKQYLSQTNQLLSGEVPATECRNIQKSHSKTEGSVSPETCTEHPRGNLDLFQCLQLNLPVIRDIQQWFRGTQVRGTQLSHKRAINSPEASTCHDNCHHPDYGADQIHINCWTSDHTVMNHPGIPLLNSAKNTKKKPEGKRC